MLFHEHLMYLLSDLGEALPSRVPHLPSSYPCQGNSFDPAKDFDNNLVKCLQSIQAKLLIASFDSDWLFPKEYGLDIQMSAIKAGIDSTYLELEGDYGHDSFLFYSDQYAAVLKNFLNSHG